MSYEEVSPAAARAGDYVIIPGEHCGFLREAEHCPPGRCSVVRFTDSAAEYDLPWDGWRHTVWIKTHAAPALRRMQGAKEGRS